MKDDIMSQFKSAISNYNFVENDQLDENLSLSSTIGDACSICSTHISRYEDSIQEIDQISKSEWKRKWK